MSLKESGMSIGSFAENLLSHGAVPKESNPPPVSITEEAGNVPFAQEQAPDYSHVEVPNDFITDISEAQTTAGALGVNMAGAQCDPMKDSETSYEDIEEAPPKRRRRRKKDPQLEQRFIGDPRPQDDDWEDEHTPGEAERIQHKVDTARAKAASKKKKASKKKARRRSRQRRATTRSRPRRAARSRSRRTVEGVSENLRKIKELMRKNPRMSRKKATKRAYPKVSEKASGWKSDDASPNDMVNYLRGYRYATAPTGNDPNYEDNSTKWYRQAVAAASSEPESSKREKKGKKKSFDADNSHDTRLEGVEAFKDLIINKIEEQNDAYAICGAAKSKSKGKMRHASWKRCLNSIKAKYGPKT